MLVLKRSNCIDQPTLVGYDLRSQLVQRAESLFESSSIDDQLTHKIQETLQSLTADANNLPPLVDSTPTASLTSSAGETSVLIGIVVGVTSPTDGACPR